MKKILLTLMVLVTYLLPVQGLHAKDIFKDDLNKVSLEKIKDADIGDIKPDHPIQISEEQIFNMLATISFSRNALIFKDDLEQRLFDRPGLEFLSKGLSQALQKAKPKQVIFFRYIRQKPNYKVFRNDRLITGHAFYHEGELYIRFKKLFAKILGDYEDKTLTRRAFSRAQDIRVGLDTLPGQRLLGTKYIALDADYDFASLVEELELQEQKRVIQEKNKDKVAPKATKGNKPTSIESADDAETVAPAVPAPDVIERLQTLEKLKQQGLISDQEYQKKRKEILGNL